MKFTLEKSTSSTRALSKFNVRNAANDIIGTINVPPNEEADLLAHWKGGAPAAATASGPHSRAVGAMLAALKQQRPVSKAALRGC